MTGEAEAIQGTISPARQPRWVGAPAKRLLALLAPLILALSLAAVSAPKASALPENFFGFQFGNGWFANEQYPSSEPDMEAVARSGAKYWRLPFDCSNKDWTRYDKEIRLAWEHGISVIANPSARCGDGTGKVPTPGEWEGAGSSWETWLYELVQHYGWNGSFWAGKSNIKPITVWEVWNEPNRGANGEDGVHANGKYYGKFLKRSANALNEAQNAQATCCGINVLMGGLLTLADGVDTEGKYNKNVHNFLEEADTVSGLDSSINGVALHPYAFDPEADIKVENNITVGRNNVNEFIGSGKSLWITEIGWPVEHGGGAFTQVSEARQSELLTAVFNWVKGQQVSKNIQSLIFYNYRDFTLDESWITGCGLRRRPPAEQFSQTTFRSAWYAFQGQTGAAKWPVAPGAETQAATNVGSTEATLNGVINPHNLPTGYHFEWGTVENGYSWSVPGSDENVGWKEGNVARNYVLSGLKPGTTYHYRIVGTNENHEIVGGGNRSFTTLPTSPAVVVDGSGVEHVYNRSPGGQLEEWYQIGTRWSKRLWGPTGKVAGSPSAVVDPSGKIWVYFRSANGQLRNWWFQGTNFAEEGHGSENRVGGDPAVIEDKEGKRWVYFKGTNGTLRNWWFQGVNWNEEEHAYANTVGGDPSVFEDKEGKRWVYYRGSNGTLRNWWFKGVNWNEEEHAYANTVGGDVSAFEDKEGKRWVYYRGSNGTVRNWWFQGVNWNEEEHAYANTVGGDVSAFEDTEGKRWVYFKGTNGQLKAWWFKGVNWNEEGIGAAGVVAGDPKGIARPSGKREVFYFNGAGAPFRWRFGPSEASLDTLASLMPFATSSQWATWDPAYSLILADVNGDGKDDIVGRGPTADVRVKLSTGTTFAAASQWATWDLAYSLILADVNGDGKDDIVGRNSSGEVRVKLSTGTSFAAASEWATLDSAYLLALADVNGDGKDDIVARGPTADVRVKLSTGTTFAAASQWATWDLAYTLALADVNGDGKDDIVGRNSSGEVRVKLSTGSTFAAASQWTTWNSAYSGELADVNGDGRADIVGRGPAADVQVGLSTASIFAASSEWTSWSNAFSTAFADVNGGGRADIIGRNSTGEVQVGLSTP